jgi:hypothetical protein
MRATRAQKPEMLMRDAHHRPHGATWLNGERWEDETEITALPGQALPSNGAAAAPSTRQQPLSRYIPR